MWGRCTHDGDGQAGPRPGAGHGVVTVRLKAALLGVPTPATGTVTHILLPTRRATASSRLNHLTGECNQLKLNYHKPTLRA